MAHFAYTRAGGVWASLSDFDHTEAADFDAKIFKAINGDEGGTWAPSSVITIGGSGIAVSGPANFTGFVGITGAFGFDVDTPANFFNDVHFDQDVTLQGNVDIAPGAPTNLLHVHCLAQFDAQALFNAVVNFAAATFCAAKLTAQLGIDITGGLLACAVPAQFDDDTVIGLTSGNTSYFNASVTFAAPVTLSGAGHVRKRLVTGANADTTYNVSTVDVIRIPTGVLSAARVYTIGTTGAAAGSMIRIYTEDEVYAVSVRRVDTTQIGLQLRKNQAGHHDWMDIIYTGSSWEPCAFGNYTV